MKEKLASLWQKLFGDSVRAFGLVSLIFLVSLAIAPAAGSSRHISAARAVLSTSEI